MNQQFFLPFTPIKVNRRREKPKKAIQSYSLPEPVVREGGSYFIITAKNENDDGERE